MNERLPHPGSWAAAATLVLGVAAWPVFWAGYGRGDATVLLLGVALVPASLLTSLWSLVSDPHRSPGRWVLVVLARAWALGWVSLLLQWAWSGATRDPLDGRQPWAFWAQWGLAAALVLLVGVGVGLTIRRVSR